MVVGARRRWWREVSRDAAEWVREKLGFTPDAQQARVLATEAKRGLLHCTRQWGKAYHGAESLTLVVSPSARRSGEFVQAAGDSRGGCWGCRRAMRRCGDSPRCRSEGKGYTVPKRDLITWLQLLLQRGGLQIAEGLEDGPTEDVRGAGAVRGMAGGGARRFSMAVSLACWAWRRTGQAEWEAALRAAVL
jgi:hypothetical protein